MPSLLTRLLPATGLLCVATKLDPPKTGFAHRFCQSAIEAEQVIKTLDAEGKTVYIAQASYVTPENRKGINAHRVKSFWFDIDCGPEKYAASPDESYPTQRDGADALKDFIGVVGLPMPTVVSSGNGLYAHWILTEEVLPNQWRGVASVLKKLCDTLGFKADRSRTADIASVLRPVGSTNRKYGEKPVQLALETPAVEFTSFAAIIHHAAKQHKIDAAALAPPKHSDLNSDFATGLEGPPSSGFQIAEHCAQIRRFRDLLGNISEPEWYAGIGVLRHTEEGEELIQAWSLGHPEYTPESTRAKIAQHKMPPTTCHHYGQVHPTGCIGCRHNGKIKTPVVLGRTLQQIEAAQIDADRMEMPAGYVITESGLVFEEDTIRFYGHDIYPCLVARDASLGQETVKFKHYLPLEGWSTFVIPSALMRDPKQLLMKLQENHVGVTGNTEGKLMHDYLSRYVDKLRSGRRITNLFSQMGWKKENEDLVFVIGDRMINREGEVSVVGLAKNIPEAANYFITKGSLQTWIEGTKHLDHPERRSHQFTFLAGFGAPLMMFTGFEGATVSVVGRSGIGKTLMSRWALSIFGDPNKLLMSKEDTKNSLVARLGVYGSLPFAIDEVSNIDAMDLSDIVYRITQGRDKVRLGRNAAERPVNNQWNTLAIVSSNHSLCDRLASAKSDASAELNRVFEYTMEEDPSFTKELATSLYRIIQGNYGEVGELYLQYLVKNQDKHAGNLDKIMSMLDARTGAKAQERFLSATIAVVVYGGMIAKQLGLIAFAMEPVVDWAVEAMIQMRHRKTELVTDSVALLGQFLDLHTGNTLVLSQHAGKNGAVIARRPHNRVVVRYEEDTKKCYLSRDELKKYLNKHFGSYAQMKQDLERLAPKPALLRADHRKVLGAGTPDYAGAAQYVWEIDLTAPALGNIIAQLVEHEASGKATDEAFQPTPMRRVK